MTVNTKAILFYSTIVVFFAWLCTFTWIAKYFSAYGFVGSLILGLIIGWTPALLAFISWQLFGKENKTSSLLGTWSHGALIMAFIPAIVFGIFGYQNESGLNPHIAGFLFGLFFLIYALGEEIGWRGYMHDALSPKPILVRGLLIGIVWYIWHLWFLQESGMDPILILKGLAIIVPTAILFSWLVSENRSWLAMAAFHCVGNIGFMGKGLNIPSDERLMIAGIALCLLIFVHHFWKKRLVK